MLHDPSIILAMESESRRADACGSKRLHQVGLLGGAAFLVYLAVTFAYFAYRIPLWNPEAPVISCLMLAAELFGTMTLLLHLFSTWTLVERQAPPPSNFEANILITT